MSVNSTPGPTNGDFWKKAMRKLYERIDNAKSSAIVKVNDKKAQAQKIQLGLIKLFQRPTTKKSMSDFFEVFLRNFDGAEAKAFTPFKADENYNPSNLFKNDSDTLTKKIKLGKLELPIVSLLKKSNYAEFLIDDLKVKAHLHELHNGKYYIELFFPKFNRYLAYGYMAIPDQFKAVSINPQLMNEFKQKFDEKVAALPNKANPASSPAQEIPVSQSPNDTRANLNEYEKFIFSSLNRGLNTPTHILNFILNLNYILHKSFTGDAPEVDIGYNRDEKVDILNYNHGEPGVPPDIPLYDDFSKNIIHGYLRFGKNISFELKLIEPRDPDKEPKLELIIPNLLNLHFDLNDDSFKLVPGLDNQLKTFVYNVRKKLQEKSVIHNQLTLTKVKAARDERSKEVLLNAFQSAVNQKSQESFENLLDKINFFMDPKIRNDGAIIIMPEIIKKNILVKDHSDGGATYDKFRQGKIKLPGNIEFAYQLFTDSQKSDTVRIISQIKDNTLDFTISADQGERAAKLMQRFVDLYTRMAK